MTKTHTAWINAAVCTAFSLYFYTHDFGVTEATPIKLLMAVVVPVWILRSYTLLIRLLPDRHSGP